MQQTSSPAELLSLLPEPEKLKALAKLPPDVKAQLLHHWPFWARPNQIAPDGDWSTWVVLAGRGFGKTRTGAEWVRSMVCGPTPLARGRANRIALIGETAADVRDVMVQGDSNGLMTVHPRDFRPSYVPSNRCLQWPNGALALTFNATEPDQLRGPQHDLAWCDELAKWRYAQETWDMLQFGLRLGNPQQLITTTPRPIPLLRQILKEPGTVVTKGSTYDNRANLAAKFFEKIIAKYEGTRLGRQELKAELLDDVPGSLWTRDGLDRHRRGKDNLPEMQRVVVAIDPAATTQEEAVKAEGAAETGIIVAGLGVDGRGYLLDDLSCSLSPNGWGRRAVSGYDLYQADAIVVERNNGGAMVKNTIDSVRPNLSVIEVWASRGKVTRAEPVSALYEQGRISHVGTFSELEDQMVLFTTAGILGETTGDRVDAAVWAFTELFPSLISKSEPMKIVIPQGRSWLAS